MRAERFDGLGRQGQRSLVRGMAHVFGTDAEDNRGAVAKAGGFAGRLNIIVAPLTRTDYVFAFPNGSPIRKQANRAILSHLETDAWGEILRRYLGADP